MEETDKNDHDLKCSRPRIGIAQNQELITIARGHVPRKHTRTNIQTHTSI